MRYPNKLEYNQKIRNAIEKSLKSYYGEDAIVKWFKHNEKINFASRIDAQVIVIDTVRSLQIKKSGSLYNFSISKDAMEAYITLRLKLDGLLVAMTLHNKIYLFGWYSFVKLARENISNGNWKLQKGQYYSIPLRDLTEKLRYEAIYCELVGK